MHTVQGGDTTRGHGVEGLGQVRRADEPDVVCTAPTAGQLAPLELGEWLKKGSVNSSLLYGTMLFWRHNLLYPGSKLLNTGGEPSRYQVLLRLMGRRDLRAPGSLLVFW